MTARITDTGEYQLFRDTNGHQVLKLDGTQLLLVQGPQGEVMASRETDFEPDQLLDSGEFKFIEFDEEDGEDHRLLLQRSGDFRVVLFVEGLPQGPDDEVLCRFSEEVVGLDEVDTYVRSLRAAAIDGRERLSTNDPVEAVRHHFRSLDFPAEKTMLLDHAHRRRAAEETIAVLDRLEDRNYDSLRDVVAAAARLERIDELGVDEASVDELIELIEAMEPAELHELREYERRFGRRDDVLEAIERQLGES